MHVKVPRVPLDVDDPISACESKPQCVAVTTVGILLPIVDVMTGYEMNSFLLLEAARDA